MNYRYDGNIAALTIPDKDSFLPKGQLPADYFIKWYCFLLSYFQDGFKFQNFAAPIDPISGMQETNPIWFLITITIQQEIELEEFFLMWSVKDDKIFFFGLPV